MANNNKNNQSNGRDEQGRFKAGSQEARLQGRKGGKTRAQNQSNRNEEIDSDWSGDTE